MESSRKRVRKKVIPGNTNSLWKAVRTAMDINVSSLPKTLYENEQKIPNEGLPDRFAKYFDLKIKNTFEELAKNEEVFNGKRKVEENNKNFMDPLSVKECIMNLKLNKKLKRIQHNPTEKIGRGGGIPRSSYNKISEYDI
jgi:hypothetical protein